MALKPEHRENGKKQLEMILQGSAPDYPPHFELLFFLEKETLGLDRTAINARTDCSADYKAAKDLEKKAFLVDEFGWSAVWGGSLFTDVDEIEHLSAVKKAIGHQTLVFGFNGQCVFWMPTGSDLMDFVVMLFERPAEMHEKARQKLEDGKRLAVRQRDAGADFIIQNSDFGFNSGPFISPQHFREFVTPYMTEFVGFVHDLGLPVILHSDGNLNDILDQIHSTGIDGYQSVDPQGSMDIKEVRERYPDWILMGNVACNLLQDEDEEQIRNCVRYCMKHGGIGRKYIFSTSNCIFEGMPVRSYQTMLSEYVSLCNTITQ